MTIKIAILGYGRSGSSLHANPIDTLPDFEMAAVCDIDPERRRQASDRFGCPVYEDCRAMLEKEKLDLVSIVTPSSMHSEMACACLEAGTNVLVTKPWCVNAGEALRMIDAANRSGSRLLPWLPSRWGSDFRRIREIVQEGRIGKVFAVRRYQFGYATRSDWQTETRFGGGILLNWGPHLLDTPMLLAGGRATSAYGQLRHLLNPGDAEDSYHAIINMDSGVAVHSEWSFAARPLPSWFVQGDAGTIIAHDNRITVVSGPPDRPHDPTDAAAMSGSKQVEFEETVGADIYGDEKVIYAEIAQALRGECEYPVRPGDALALTRVIDAIKASSKQNQVVFVES